MLPSPNFRDADTASLPILESVPGIFRGRAVLPRRPDFWAAQQRSPTNNLKTW